MYTARVKSLTTERHFPDDFDKLGLQVNAQGQIRVKGSNKPFKFRISKHQRTLTLHIDAVLEAVRKYVAERLAVHGITPFYLKGDRSMSHIMPSEPYVPILLSNPKLLIKKKSVIIICGEHLQDLGILSQCGATGDLGMHRSSALDITAHLCVWDYLLGQGTSYTSVVVEKNKLPFEPDIKIQNESTPGLIVLNTGQHLYSYEHNKTYSNASWDARSGSATSDQPHVIHPRYNLVNGHKTVDEHLDTFFRYVLPGIIDYQAKICLIAVGDGARSILTVLDKMLGETLDRPLVRQLGRTTLIASTHDHADLKSKVLLEHLANAAIAWKMNNSPKGTVLGRPASMPADFRALGYFNANNIVTPSLPVSIVRKPATIEGIVSSGRYREISPLMLRLEEAKKRGEVGSGGTNSDKNSSPSSSDKDLVPFQNDDFSPPPSPKDLLFPMDGSPKMQQKDEENLALVDANRQLLAQVKRIPSAVKERVTDWVATEHNASKSPNEVCFESPILRTHGNEQQNEELIRAGAGFDDLEALGISGRYDSGDDSDGRLFIAGHNRPRLAHPPTAGSACETDPAEGDPVLQDDIPMVPSDDKPTTEHTNTGKNAAPEDDTEVVELVT